MGTPIDCEGAPRDLGLDQGRACAAHLGARFSGRPLGERLRLLASRPAAGRARLARDVARYFPRHAETLDGLARGARVPRGWLMEQLAGAPPSPATGFSMPALGATGALTALGPLVARGLPEPRTEPWVLRRARPEGGFASLELGPAWFAGALAGVSEVGLAAAVVQRTTARNAEECAAPAALLVQDCLHRFESLEGALDWCLGRPVGGSATLVLADAEGDVAAVSIEPNDRRVHRPADGLALASLDGDGAKALREAAPLRADDLAGIMGARLAVLDPARRRVGVGSPGSTTDWVGL